MREFYLGEDITVKTESDCDVAVGQGNKIYAQTKSDENGDAKIEVDTFFEPGHYSIVVTNNGKFVSTETICIKSPFINKSKKEQLREMIRNLDAVIDARLTNNVDAIQSMSINGKSYVYETLETLMNARRKFTDQLADVIQAENIKKGKSPIINIKTRFNNPR
ncbi:hypothetical protein [Serratia marcescens]|uniref:hypothetical protein n=1 Tax=Serratia marcescens TaxID=615 RepID=UPI0006667FFC|nr:hypothetical protein [Serratia marcescens]BEN87060.1 hypothetical protein SMQC07_08590 [Serratia marcescens]BEN92247.1 hypothetical protein SMQC08_08600 [Serratia marcescens]BEN97573.1 hypothetical protein SMQC11_08620 [Serratia marcescens]